MDDTCVRNAISSLPAAGGTVFLAPNETYHFNSGVSTGTKTIRLLCGDSTTNITGTGITMYTIQSSWSSVESCFFSDPIGNTSTIAINIDNGISGVNNFLIDRVYATGTGRLGIGLRTNFALKGSVTNSEFNRWNQAWQPNGIDVNHRTTTITTVGSKFRESNYGIYAAANSIDDIMLTDTVVEGNLVAGISCSGPGSFIISSSHFENVGVTNIGANGCNIMSTLNYYVNAGAGLDIAATGSTLVESDNDTLNSGVTNNGTLTITVRDPENAVPAPGGSGCTINYASNSVIAPNCSSQNFPLAGFNVFDMEMPWFDLGSGHDTRIGAQNGQFIRFLDKNETIQGTMDTNGGGKLTLNGGLNVFGTMCAGSAAGTACKHVRAGPCTTGATAGNACAISIIWPGTAFRDTNYSVVCSLEGANNAAVFAGFNSKSTTGGTAFVMTILNSASSAEVSCIALHD